MKKILVFLFATFILRTHSIGQTAPLIDWQVTLGGDTSDQLYSVHQTGDGGYILGGISISNLSGDKTEPNYGNFDYWLVKTDSLGTVLWQNTIGGNDVDVLNNVIPTYDGGYILGGFSLSNTSGDKTENSLGNNDYWVVKTDSLGNILWQNTIGGNDDDRLYSIIQTRDGGYLLGGYSRSNISGDKTENCSGYSDYWIVKIKANGVIDWQKTIGGSAVDQLSEVLQTTDGGFLLAGRSTSDSSGDKTENSRGNYDYWIVRTDSTGTILWDKTFGGSNNDLLSCATRTNDFGFLIGGNSTSDISGDKTENSNGMEDFWILKLDATGNLQWQKTIGGDNTETLNSAEQTQDGGYVLGGWSRSGISGDKTSNTCMGTNDYWVVKLDSAGAITWQSNIGGDAYDQLYNARQTSDGGYILGGYSASGLSCEKTDTSRGFFDFWLIKLLPETITGISIPSSAEKYQLQLFPNPVSEILHLVTAGNGEIFITDPTGQMIMHPDPGTAVRNEISLDVSALAKGIYFVRSGNETTRFIKQ